MKKKWKWIAGGTATFFILAFLALRFGGQLLEPFLSGSSNRGDSLLATVSPDSTAVTLASVDTSGMITQYGPFVIDGRSYTFQVQRDTGGVKPREAARRVQAFDANGRVLYDENLYLRGDSTSSESWIQFTPTLIEDASGITRGFKFTYEYYPSAPNSGVAFSLVAPRADSLVVLTPTAIGYYGNVRPLPSGSAFGAQRLELGNHLVVESGRGWFTAAINLRLDFGCAPRKGDCIRVDLPDSVAGLAKFPVDAGQRRAIDTAVVLEVWSAPHGNNVEKIVIPAGQQAEILGGAAKVYFDRTTSLFLSADDEWLEVRINGKRGWITGPESFMAIGLQQS